MLRLQKRWLDLEHAATLTVHTPDGDEEVKVEAGRSLLPTSDLRLLWNDRADWRFHAKQLKRRGKWRKP